ncbi:MAG: PTS sugar transporter subunit IIC [Erysipelotrichia bacterium]|nr:PTS sugar transporter subunit IIC [Erysipelotrichia bacterium]
MSGKIALIILISLVKQILGYFSLVPGAAGGVLFNSVVTGLVLGDLPTGLALGGMYELMNIGLNPLGESTVPNYNLGSIVGVFFAITVDRATGTAMGIVVATLATMLKPFSEYPSLLFKNGMEKALKEHNWKKVQILEIINWIPGWAIQTAIPVAIVCGAGESIAEAMIKFIPEWLTNGFTVAGNALPALGFAIVLRSMNVNKGFEYLLIGFVLYAYMNVGTVGAALIGVAVALIKFRQAKLLETMQDSTSAGGIGDE